MSSDVSETLLNGEDVVTPAQTDHVSRHSLSSHETSHCYVVHSPSNQSTPTRSVSLSTHNCCALMGRQSTESTHRTTLLITVVQTSQQGILGCHAESPRDALCLLLQRIAFYTSIRCHSRSSELMTDPTSLPISGL